MRPDSWAVFGLPVFGRLLAAVARWEATREHWGRADSVNNRAAHREADVSLRHAMNEALERIQ